MLKRLNKTEKGILQENQEKNRKEKDQGILNQVCRTIEEAGYSCQTAVGHSKFKIDAAVLNPCNEEEYLLGILLDGESYRQSENTKDREVSQIDVLKGLGWNLHRIWTMDWWDNREKELTKLVQILEKRKAEALNQEVFLNKEAIDGQNELPPSRIV